MMFITIGLAPEDLASIVMAEAMHKDAGGNPKPLTTAEYLLELHREHIGRTRGNA